jgi:para-aminobenzoate synthetase component 1
MPLSELPSTLGSAAPAPRTRAGTAWFAGVRASEPVECIDVATQAERLLDGGFWVVVGDFEGPVRAWRFADRERVSPAPLRPVGPWVGPAAREWRSSLERDAYCAAVEEIRSRVRDGDVYQVNLCRTLSAPLSPRGTEPDAQALGAKLAAGNPAPFGGGIHIPAGSDVPPVWVVTASPELYLRVEDGFITSGPIKGTATTAAGLSAKDRAENIMIADMVRNDLQRICDAGTVEVTALLALEHHPGLVHLVTTVQGRLRGDGAVDWANVLAATYPPASVSGAPKIAALEVIGRLEPVPRGPYCGAVGWIDADAGRAEIAVGIRTFWWTPDEGGRLHFGTGAGITWGSDQQAEWDETELKASRLVALASVSD